jgi:hypothetical protein
MRGKIFAMVAMNALVLTLMVCRPVAAGVDVNINIQVPPPIAIVAPPPLVLIPGTYAYFAPDMDVDIIFFQGFWYRPFRGGWYRADDYNGRWVLVPSKRVPLVIMNLPPNWKRIPPGHQRIPHSQVKSNWKAWERDKYWDKKEKNREKRESKHGGGNGRGKGKGKHGGD